MSKNAKNNTIDLLRYVQNKKKIKECEYQRLSEGKFPTGNKEKVELFSPQNKLCVPKGNCKGRIKQQY